jgi:hypothetical protein
MRKTTSSGVAAACVLILGTCQGCGGGGGGGGGGTSPDHSKDPGNLNILFYPGKNIGSQPTTVNVAFAGTHLQGGNVSGTKSFNLTESKQQPPGSPDFFISTKAEGLNWGRWSVQISGSKGRITCEPVEVDYSENLRITVADNGSITPTHCHR